jgi:hypothetical protein
MADLLSSMSGGGKAEDASAAAGNKVPNIAAVLGIRSGKGFGIMSKKVFDKANCWSWTANVTLVDWDGTGLVWDRFEWLKNKALPHVTVGGDDAGAASGVLSAGIAGALNGGLVGGAKALAAGAAATVGAAVLARTVLSPYIDEEALQGALCRSSVKAPEPVHIRIGRYAQTQGASPVASMKVVIDTFGFTASKEMTEAGPVACTFNISFSSVETMTAESVPVGAARVTIVEG